MTTTPETHRVLAVTLDGAYAEPAGARDWISAQTSWQRHDDARRAGRRPHVRHYIVRSTSDPDPRWAKAQTAAWPFLDVVGSRGYGDDSDAIGRQSRAFSAREKAARAAAHRRVPQGPNGNPNGTGGWYYGPGGRVLAQGLTDLAEAAERRGWIVQSTKDGRWFPVVHSG